MVIQIEIQKASKEGDRKAIFTSQLEDLGIGILLKQGQGQSPSQKRVLFVLSSSKHLNFGLLRYFKPCKCNY